MLIGTALLITVANKTTSSQEWMSFAESHYLVLSAVGGVMVAAAVAISWITGRTLIPAILLSLAAVPVGLVQAVYKARRNRSTWGM